MPLEDFIIKTYILVDDFLKTVPTLSTATIIEPPLRQLN
jgi:hypothetical protein